GLAEPVSNTAAPDQSSTAERNLEPEPVAAALPAWKPEWMKDVSVSIGTKVWVNKWQSHRFPDPNSFFPLDDKHHLQGVSNNTTSISVASDEEVTPIPTLNIRYKHFFAAASYYSETGFNFHPTFESGSLYGVSNNFKYVANDPNSELIGSYNSQYISSAKRTEWDVTVGYSLTPNIAILAGYKNIRQKIHESWVYQLKDENGKKLKPFGDSRDFDRNIDGALLGISLAAPLTHGFGAYFNYTHGFMTTMLCGCEGVTFDGDYDLMEGGVAYALNGKLIPAGVPLSSATLFAGYRYQYLTLSDDSNYSDITQGFAAGLNLSF
ncbi:MAG: hypothetical protein ABL903_17010, partial [Methylococcales bacterium]